MHILEYGSGKIQQILAHTYGGNGAGVIMFKTEVNANKAECSTAGNGSQWAFSLESEYGKAMYSLLLTAQAQNKTVSVVGMNDCSAWADRERPKFIAVNF